MNCTPLDEQCACLLLRGALSGVLQALVITKFVTLANAVFISSPWDLYVNSCSKAKTLS